MRCPECDALFIPFGGNWDCPFCEQYVINEREWFGNAHNRRSAPPLTGRSPDDVRQAIREARSGARRPVSFKTWEVDA